MSERLRLLLIDPQVDFCDGPANGALPVPGAHADMLRMAALVDRLGDRIRQIHVTLDSHHVVDIAHPAWWVDETGNAPAPFTLISAEDVTAGRWRARNPAWQSRSLDYVRQLQAQGKYALVIWPPHCLIGSPGHAVHPDLFAALRRWEERTCGVVDYVTKGADPFTEHYSAVAAEVPDPADPATLLNRKLVEALADSDRVLVAGEALSHCVKATVTDIANALPPEQAAKFVLLTDGMSPVPAMPGGPDFPAMGHAFLAEMQERGMRLATSDSV